MTASVKEIAIVDSVILSFDYVWMIVITFVLGLFIYAQSNREISRKEGGIQATLASAEFHPGSGRHHTQKNYFRPYNRLQWLKGRLRYLMTTLFRKVRKRFPTQCGKPSLKILYQLHNQSHRQTLVQIYRRPGIATPIDAALDFLLRRLDTV